MVKLLMLQKSDRTQGKYVSPIGSMYGISIFGYISLIFMFNVSKSHTSMVWVQKRVKSCGKITRRRRHLCAPKVCERRRSRRAGVRCGEGATDFTGDLVRHLEYGMRQSPYHPWDDCIFLYRSMDGMGWSSRSILFFRPYSRERGRNIVYSSTSIIFLIGR